MKTLTDSYGCNRLKREEGRKVITTSSDSKATNKRRIRKKNTTHIERESGLNETIPYFVCVSV